MNKRQIVGQREAHKARGTGTYLDLFFSASYVSYVSVTAGRDGGVYVGYTGVRGMPPAPRLADSFRCISSCFAFRFRSSVASSSLF